MCIYVDPSDIEDIYSKIAMLLADPEHRSRLESRIARSKLKTWDQVSDELMAIILANAVPVAAKR
jgi:hypothetical protein